MIAGGGGFRVPLVYRALVSGPFAGLVSELVLFDVDPARLSAIAAVLRAMPTPACTPDGEALRRRPRRRHSPQCAAARRPHHHVPAGRPPRDGPRVRGHPPRRHGRPDRRRTCGPGPRPAGPGNHGRRRHLLRPADHPGNAAPGTADAGTLPGRLADQLHQPGRHGHGSARACPRPQGHRDLRFRGRAGAPGGPRGRRFPCRTEGSTAWATTG